MTRLKQPPNHYGTFCFWEYTLPIHLHFNLMERYGARNGLYCFPLPKKKEELDESLVYSTQMRRKAEASIPKRRR